MSLIKKWLNPGNGVQPALPHTGLLLALLAGLYWTSLQHYLLFHTLVELFRILVVFGIATLAWNARRQIDNPLLVLAGLAFPAVGFIELMHILAYKGMGVFAADANLPTQLWVATRAYESMVMLGAVLLSRITLRIGPTALFFNLLGAALLWSVFAGRFPDCFVEGTGLTPFKIGIEYVISAVFAATLMALFIRRDAVPDQVRAIVAWSMGINIAAELSFTQYVSVYGQANMMGHLLLLVSTYCLYRALLIKGIQEPQALLFNQLQREKALLERSEAELTQKVAERTRELSQANSHLQIELEERKRAQQRLAESEKLLRLTRNAALDAMIMMDPHGRIDDWNPAAERMFGYSAQEVLGRQLHETLAPPHYRPAYEKGMACFHAEGKGPLLGKITEFQARHKDGREIPVEVALSPLKFHGRWYAVGVARDISERKAVQRMREELAAIVESAIEPIVGKDLRGTITSWNSGAERLYGYTAEEMIGCSINLLADETHFQETEQLMQRIANGELIENFETKRVRKDGRHLDVILTLSPIRNSAGEIIGVSTIVHDITERKASERALRQVNKALTLLSTSNQTLLHAKSEEGLLDRMCEVVTEIGGYRGAWVGFLADDGNLVPREWSCPQLGEQLRELAPTWNAATPPTARACMRDGRTTVDAEADSFVGDLVLRMALPLKDKGETTFGCLCILTGIEFMPDAREIATLEELAADLSFGIFSLRSQHTHELSMQQLARTMEDTVRAMAATVEMRDIYTAGHQRRVAELAKAIAIELGLEAERTHGIELAATIHDLGKINIPAEILTKPAQLSPIERNLIQSHPQVGYDIIKDIEFPWPIAQAILQHHERIDGSGYPNGLKGDAILLEARIIAVADMVEAMSSHRPYRPGLGIEAALAELSRCRGSSYDIDAADACIRLFREKDFRFTGVWGMSDRLDQAHT